MCVDTNQDGKIDFMEFTERFHNPAKDIGFNMAVLLTNLSEHMPYDIRLQRLMDKAKSFLSYFQEYLGRIEIKGGAGYIERVYFEITESNIEQWNKPHIKVCCCFLNIKTSNFIFFSGIEKSIFTFSC